MEYDGVVVEDTSDIQRKAWQKMAEEEGKRAPPQFLLQRAEGMKNDQVRLKVHTDPLCSVLQIHLLPTNVPNHRMWSCLGLIKEFRASFSKVKVNSCAAGDKGGILLDKGTNGSEAHHRAQGGSADRDAGRHAAPASS